MEDNMFTTQTSALVDLQNADTLRIVDYCIFSFVLCTNLILMSLTLLLRHQQFATSKYLMMNFSISVLLYHGIFQMYRMFHADGFQGSSDFTCGILTTCHNVLLYSRIYAFLFILIDVTMWLVDPVRHRHRMDGVSYAVVVLAVWFLGIWMAVATFMASLYKDMEDTCGVLNLVIRGSYGFILGYVLPPGYILILIMLASFKYAKTRGKQESERRPDRTASLLFLATSTVLYILLFIINMLNYMEVLVGIRELVYKGEEAFSGIAAIICITYILGNKMASAQN